MNTIVSNIIGYAAAVCLMCGYLPQAIFTIRTRNTEGLSLLSWTLMMIGSLFFVVQGLLTWNIPLVITNFVTFVCSAIVTWIKVSNDREKCKRCL